MVQVSPRFHSITPWFSFVKESARSLGASKPAVWRAFRGVIVNPYLVYRYFELVTPQLASGMSLLALLAWTRVETADSNERAGLVAALGNIVRIDGASLILTEPAVYRASQSSPAASFLAFIGGLA
jgi:hypothetical protein